MGAKPLSGMRIIICGKGGGGKSTLTALMARVLTEKGYDVHVVDGDPSNPGLYRMLGFEKAPEPLMDFFGGTVFTGGKVTCPVDDPFPLPRGTIALDEIPSKYFMQKNGITFFRTGKIQVAFEGCDGPEDKIARDFIVPGEQVTLVDIKAGLEHFGRGVEINFDGIITVIDPNVIAFEIAERVKMMIEEMKRGISPAVSHLEDPKDVEMIRKLAKSVKIRYAWAILNKVNSEEVKSVMMRELGKRGIEPIGSVRNDPEIFKSCLEDTSIRESGAKKDIEEIVKRLEDSV
ncbi:MAG TPA: P-loop NTPase [Dehalococcoidia bacterium]|nr:P-loop NTPase [Dehalococcoidia bacterium]